MELFEYRKKYGITRTALAKKVGIHPATLKYIENFQEKDMKLSVALSIEEATEGQVKVTELLKEAVWRKNRDEGRKRVLKYETKKNAAQKDTYVRNMSKQPAKHGRSSKPRVSNSV